MIITEIRGGLANQMFQYAFAKQLCFLKGLPLIIDASYYQNQTEDRTFRAFGLTNFNIQATIATELEIKEVKGINLSKNRKRISIYLRNLIPYFKKRVVKEQFPHFDPNIFKIKGPSYVSGFWQTEKYFVSIAEEIKKDFTLKDSPHGKNKDYLEQIIGCKSVSLHVRRGDYVTNEHYNKIHVSLSVDYYEKAANYMFEHLGEDIHFFVFSDDLEWCKENLKFNTSITFVEGNDGDTAHEDMRLMWSCKHNIIANSTFSWWGAWLNSNPNKIVVAPNKWYKKQDLENRDITPDNWVKI